MEINYTPIGVFRCENSKPYGAPRQASLNKLSEGEIVLKSPMTKDCITDLSGFDRLWIIYDFHKNTTWKPKVRPPRGSQIKRGVFSTRSPYRPNSIGLSCVALKKIEGLKIYVQEHDLLDGTPILDIKPYLPYADSFPMAKTGWLVEGAKFEINFSAVAEMKLKWLNQHLNFDVFETVKNQLEFNPTCRKAKRVKKYKDHYIFSLQAWRLVFEIKENSVIVTDLYSGYCEEELKSPKTPPNEVRLHNNALEFFKDLI